MKAAPGVADVVSSIAAARPATLDRDGCAELLGEVRRVRAWLDSVEVAAARRVRELADTGRAEPTESLIAQATDRSTRDAREVDERTSLCDEAPPAEAALAAGDVTSSHLDAINAAARHLDPEQRTAYLAHTDDLLARARQVSIEQFRRECRDLAKHIVAISRRGMSDGDELEAQRAASKISRWTDKATGMRNTLVELDPVRDQQLHQLLVRHLAKLRREASNKGVPWKQLEVTAFLHAVTGESTAAGGGDGASDGAAEPVPASTSPGRSDDAATGHPGPGGAAACRCRPDRIPEATLLIDLPFLLGLLPHGRCETSDGVPIPIATARRLCCEAEVLPAVLGAGGEVLDVGRSRRTATRSQRRALAAMHRCCAFPGCDVGFDACRIHHVRWWWEHGGRTDIGNLLPVCERHHHLLHEGRWGLTLASDAARTATWTRPDGEVHHVGSTVSRQPLRPQHGSPPSSRRGRAPRADPGEEHRP